MQDLQILQRLNQVRQNVQIGPRVGPLLVQHQQNFAGLQLAAFGIALNISTRYLTIYFTKMLVVSGDINNKPLNSRNIRKIKLE